MYFSSCVIHWIKQLFKIKQTSSTSNVLFIQSNFGLYSSFKMSLEPNIARNNLFLSACRCEHARISSGHMDLNNNFAGIIGCVDSCLEVFLSHKCSEYMKLLDQCDYIVVKALATVTYLDEDQIHVCLVM